MRYTPVELRHLQVGRTTFRGYKRAEVDALLVDIADSFAEVWRDRGELTDKLEDVEQCLEEVKQRENLLAATLVAAEKTAAAAIESAKREAEVIVAEAHQESRSITRAGQNERERLFAEVRRIETLLRAALGMVEEADVAIPSTEGAAAAPWPNRENTSEFQAVQPAPEPAPLPPVQETPPEQDDDGPWAGRDFAWG